MAKKNSLVMPVVKWVGGKRQLIDEIKKNKPTSFKRYFEPFFGGGAVLFELQPKEAYINDINNELINTYLVIKNNVEELIVLLSKHVNSEEYFYKMRYQDRDSILFSKLSELEKASRIIYLNKTCYNGLFRVNSQGQFNTPFANYKNPNIVNSNVLRAVSKFFNNNKIEITSLDFEKAISKSKKGDFVYLDPPYDPISDTSSFTGYSEISFGKNEQIRLKKACDELNKKGVNFLVSNSSTDFIHNLYKEYNIVTVKAKRSINSKGDKRGLVDEVLIKNYE